MKESAHLSVTTKDGSIKCVSGARPHRFLLSTVEAASEEAAREASNGLVQEGSGGIA